MPRGRESSFPSTTRSVDVRVIAATNGSLVEMIEQGDFREDLLYRLNLITVHLPPLRERKGDIPLLAREFLQRFNAEHDTDLAFSDSALAVLSSCYFPGNVRELENCVRRTATLAHGVRIVADDFACRHDECMSAVLWKKSADSPTGYVTLPIGCTDRHGAQNSLPNRDEPKARGVPPEASSEYAEHELAETVASADEVITDEAGDADSERARLVDAMEKAGWVQAKAARLLNLTPRQIGYALRKHNISVKKF